jgi:hypothetical protein
MTETEMAEVIKKQRGQLQLCRKIILGLLLRKGEESFLKSVYRELRFSRWEWETLPTEFRIESGTDTNNGDFVVMLYRETSPSRPNPVRTN